MLRSLLLGLLLLITADLSVPVSMAKAPKSSSALTAALVATVIRPASRASAIAPRFSSRGFTLSGEAGSGAGPDCRAPTSGAVIRRNQRDCGGRFGSLAGCRRGRHGRRRLRRGLQVRIRIRKRIGGSCVIGGLPATATAWTSAFSHLIGFRVQRRRRHSPQAQYATGAMRHRRGHSICRVDSEVSREARGQLTRRIRGPCPAFCTRSRAPCSHCFAPGLHTATSHYCLYASTLRDSCPEGYISVNGRSIIPHDCRIGAIRGGKPR